VCVVVEEDWPMLTQEEIATVQGDWANVRPIASKAATLFYDRLFELDPSLRSLFRPDLGEQKKKLVLMLSAAVAGLDDLPKLVPVVEDLGRRHVGYGVVPEQYATVASALLWTLKQGLGAAFDDAHVAAWTKVYGLLAQTMLSAPPMAQPETSPK
jgi:hemoglobin-like flavoprotein